MCQGIPSDLDLTEHLHEYDDENSLNDIHRVKLHEGTSLTLPLLHVICKESCNGDMLKTHENICSNSEDILQTHEIAHDISKKIQHICITCQDPFKDICAVKGHESSQDISKVKQQSHRSVHNITTKFLWNRKSADNASKKFSQDPESICNISKEILPMCITCQLPFNDNCMLECHEREYDLPKEILQTSESLSNVSKTVPMCITCQKPFDHHCVLEGHECSKQDSASNSIPQSQESIYNTPKNILQIHETISYTPEEILPLCFRCQKPFNNICFIKGHKTSEELSKVHIGKQDTSKKVICEVCHKTFGKRSALMRHLLIHTGERPYVCDICNSTFAKKINLDRHQLKHSGIKPFTCEICQRGFQTRQHLDQHHLVHTGERPYECSICQKNYSQKSNLNRHLITHIEKKPYFCNICQKGFAQKSHLFRHLRVHTGEKPFECDVCQKSFTQRSGLDRHALIHTNERSFICEICPKAFRRQSHLDQHVQTHYRKYLRAQTNFKKSYIQYFPNDALQNSEFPQDGNLVSYM